MSVGEAPPEERGTGGGCLQPDVPPLLWTSCQPTSYKLFTPLNSTLLSWTGPPYSRLLPSL